MTGCWSVFYFQYGESTGELENDMIELTKLKLFKKIKENSFEHSVFGFGFRKSSIDTNNVFDEVVLCEEDAENYNSIPDGKYEEALNYFGKLKPKKIKEFPI